MLTTSIMPSSPSKAANATVAFTILLKLLEEKCRITKVEFKPDLLYDETRLSEARKFWTIALARLTKDLPDFDRVISELRNRLTPLQE